jgi:hypothetical protein
VAALRTRTLALLLVSVFLLSSASTAALPSTSPTPARAAPAATTSTGGDSCVTNGYIAARVDDSTGLYTFDEGGCYYGGGPSAYILFPLGTSFVSVADFTSGAVYTEGGQGGATPLGDPLNSSVVNDSIITYFQATPEGLVVVQNITVAGSSSDTSALVMAVRVINEGTAPQTVGVRYLWDIDVSGYDGTWLQKFDNETAGAILGYETSFSPPPGALTSIGLAGCLQGSTAPPPYACSQADFGGYTGSVVYASVSAGLGATTPASLVYAWWGGTSYTAYGYHPASTNEIGSYAPNIAGSQDSALLYYFSNETLAANGGALSDGAAVGNYVPPSHNAPTVSLSPDSGPAGTVVTVSGVGLSTSKPLTMTSFGSLAPAALSGACGANSTGYLVLSQGCKFTVPGSVPTGPYALKFSDGKNAPTTGFTVTAPTGKPTGMRVSCQTTSPPGAPRVITCKAKVTGHSPSGRVAWSQSGAGTVAFLSPTCTLSAGVCSVKLVGASSGTVTIEGSYLGDSSNPPSSAQRNVVIGKALPLATVVCTLTSLAVGQSAVCTVTVTKTYLTPTGSVTWLRDGGWWRRSNITNGWFGSTGGATFSTKSCTLVSASCQVTLTGARPGSFMIKVIYQGDANNMAAQGWLLLSITSS